MKPPRPEKRPHLLMAHGDERVDSWFWLRDKSDPAVTAHLDAENAYTQARMAHTENLQETLFTEIIGRILETDLSVAVLDGGWWYYSRTVQGMQYPIHCRRPAPIGADGMPERPGPAEPFEPGADPSAAPTDDEVVLLDENETAGSSGYFALGAFDVSPDHRMLAYSTDMTGAEVYELWVKDLDTGEIIDGPVSGTYYGLAWARDASVLFYTRPDAAMRPFQLWRHRIGSPASDDLLVYEEDDQRFNLSVGISKDEEVVIIDLESRTTSETRIIDARNPEEAPRLLLQRREGVEHSVEHFAGTYLVLTNDEAEDFRLVVSPVAHCDHNRWVDLVPHRPGKRLEGFDIFDEYLVIFERSSACARMAVMGATGTNGPGGVPWNPASLTPIPQSEDVSTTWDSANPDLHTKMLRYEYSSMVTPRCIFDYDMSTRERTLLKSQPVLGGYDPSLYTTERLWARSADGTEIPLSIVFARSTDLATPSPTLLYGYGSYEASMDPVFSSIRLSLLDRGFVFAIAHIRGGGELGRRWYEDGKMLAKTHTFEDFIACARHLIDTGVTAADLLVARGGSAGGLLMGAVANMAPELFAAIVAEVPFVDCLTTILDESLPLTVNEWEEWGNPVEDADVYRYMKSYSPYDNVRPGLRYPKILATAGLNDPRVSYWEPAKWVVRIRDANPENEVLLKTEMGAGHQGPSGRYDAWRDEAFVIAFVLDALNMTGSPVNLPTGSRPAEDNSGRAPR